MVVRDRALLSTAGSTLPLATREPVFTMQRSGRFGSLRVEDPERVQLKRQAPLQFLWQPITCHAPER